MLLEAFQLNNVDSTSPKDKTTHTKFIVESVKYKELLMDM